MAQGSGVDERRARLALVRAPGVGAQRFRQLLDAFGSAEAVCAAGDRAWSGAGLGPDTRAYLAAPNWAAVEADLAWADGPGRWILDLADARYPLRLREIPDPPPLLFVVGDPLVLSTPQIAVVGSRNPTRSGAETAQAFAADLARHGYTITSGLALGIDAAAHRGALAAGGRTIAVAGTGPDRVYPAKHRDLAAEIAGNGAVVSEFPPGTPVSPGNFPRRNRVISGLGLGVLVVEAALQSGSLVTARHAMEQGREVFAMPGSVHNPLARGCHALIRDGAKLVETTAHVLEELGFSLAEPPPARNAPREQWDADYVALLECLGHDPATVDKLVERSGLTANVVSSMLLVLELEGYVESRAGGAYVRSPTRV